MKFSKKMLWIMFLCFVGLGVSIKLSFIYYHANYDSYALPSFCSINEFVDCDAVAKTTYSQFLGIPLSYWGIFLYLIFLFLTIVDKFKNIRIFRFLEVFKNPISYISVLGILSFLSSMILATISLFVIKKLCILCVVTYFIDLIIALIASECNFKNIIHNFKTTLFDFIEGVKRYTKTFFVLLILSASFLAYSGITLNFVPKVKAVTSIKKFGKIKYNPYRIHGNTLGNPHGDVTIEIYSDFVCPLCYINNIMLHKAVQEFSNIKVIHYNFPFDKECNKYIDINMHPNACFMSKGAIAARKQGDYWGMSTLLYENKPVDMESLLKLVKKLELNETEFLKDFNSKSTYGEMANEIAHASLDEDINATPTMIINGEKVVGIKPYYKLKEILKEHGAK
ncbi:MAG: thioredoxin domain-containing protein [bacterium]|nr:thioredoxin domain-containing protein [bacterium]